MTSRAFHTAILRNAAVLVPAPRRADWLAEWNAELCYIDRDATAFCLGSFRDALWLRCHTPGAIRRMFSVDSPLRCVLFLAGLVAATLSLILPFRDVWRSFWSPPGIAQFALAMLQMYLMALLVLVSLYPPSLGYYPVDPSGPSLKIRLRRWLFLAGKFVLLTPVPMFLIIALVPFFPAAPSILMFIWIFGFRWVLADQRRRCPVCLHFLSDPVTIGSPSLSVLGRYGTELSCPYGHGVLYVPGAPTTWCSKQRWQYLSS
jgi:hypothetical protein